MASKNAKKKITLGKEKAQKVASLLSQKKGTVDVTEFLNTIHFVESVLEEYLKAKDKARPALPDDGAELEKLLVEYEQILVQLNNSGTFARFFTSNRVRHKLDKVNAQIHKQAAIIYLGLEAAKKPKDKEKEKKSSSKKGKDASEKPTDAIKDEPGKLFWENAFQQTLMVDWEDFIFQLKTTGLKIDETATRQLKYILDNSNTGFCSLFKFADFLTGFGPLNNCLDKMQSVLNADWFHGFLSSTEAEKLLEAQPPGTFLIRFSKSKAGSFAIAYVEGPKATITHTLITSCPPAGFKIEEAYNKNARGRLFVTLFEVVEFYGYLLKYAFRSDLTKQSWFHGDLSSEEAQELLKNEPEGTYLFRFSSKPGFLAVSYVTAGNHEIKHGLIECFPGGYKFDNQPPIYMSLDEVIASLGDVLKKPFNNISVDLPMKSLTNPPSLLQSDYGALATNLRKGNTLMSSMNLNQFPQQQLTLQMQMQLQAQMSQSSQNSNPFVSNQEGYGSRQSLPVDVQLVQQHFPSTTNTEDYTQMPGNSRITPSSPAMSRVDRASSPLTTNEYTHMENNQRTSAYNGAPSRPVSVIPPSTSNGNLNGDYISMPKMEGAQGVARPVSTIHSSPVNSSTGNYGEMPAVTRSPSAMGGSIAPNPRLTVQPTVVSSPESSYGKFTMAPPLQSQPMVQSPDGNYATMPNINGPLPSSPGPVRKSMAPNPSNNYGQMPNVNGSPLTSSTGIPVTSPSKTNSPEANYGKMPSVNGNATNSVLMGSSSPVPSRGDPNANYGVMPVVKNANLGPSPKSTLEKSIPSPLHQSPSDPNGNYGVMPTVSKNGSPNSTMNPSPKVDRIPSPVNQGNTDPHGNYGVMPVVQNGKMVNPSATIPSSTSTPVTKSSSNEGNYGRMPTVNGNTSSSNLPPTLTPPPSLTAPPPLNFKDSGNYGVMPNVKQSTNPPSRSLSPPPNTAPPPQTDPNSNYGRFPNPNLPTPSNNPAVKGSYGVYVPKATTTSANTKPAIVSDMNPDDYGGLPVFSNGKQVPVVAKSAPIVKSPSNSSMSDQDYGPIGFTPLSSHRVVKK